MTDIAALLRSRKSEEFEGECHLTNEEADRIITELERLRLSLSEACATGRREEQDLVDKATAWDACCTSSQKGRKAGMEEAAKIIAHMNGWGADCGSGCHAEHFAAAIRAAMEKAE